MSFGNTDDLGFKICCGILNIITFLYDIVTLPLYFIIQNPLKVKLLSKKKTAIPVDEDENSITFRSLSPVSSYHVTITENNIDTLAKLLKYSAKVSGERKCFGTREIISETDEVQPNGGTFKKYKLGDYKWKNFKLVDELASHFGKGLRQIGVEPESKVVIFAETREEWMIAAHGLFKQNFILVTIYATLGEDDIVHLIKETEATTVITSEDLLPKVAKLLPRVHNVKYVVYMENQIKSKNNPTPSGDTEVLTYKEVIELGSKSNIGDNFPQSDDIAVIMYTSGSTGVPKGVVITHKNVIESTKGIIDSVDIYQTDVFIAFLPLAHIFEFIVEHVFIFGGIKIGYSSPLTFLDNSSKLQKGCFGDVTVLKPTIIIAVPLILGRLSDGVKSKVEKSKFISRLLFNFAYRYKVRWMSLGFSTPILDRIAFKKMRALLGNNIRLIISGGSPLTKEVHELFETCFCVKLVQGYGLTETGALTVPKAFDMSYERVGPPMSSVNLKLINYEEGNYTVKDKPFPRGEIVAGGGSISVGYFKQPDKTAEDFYDDKGTRWFKTGDIGEVHSDGVLKIIDRKKDFVKLQMGEYIALGKVENMLKSHPVVNTICVYADATKNYCVALIEPDPEKLIEFAEKIGIKHENLKEICDTPEVVAAFTTDLIKFGKNAKLAKYEIPIVLKLVKEIWDVESGLLTTTFKLKRRKIQEKYKKEIDEMYSM